MVHLGIILTTPFTPQGVVEPSPLSRSGFICSVFALRSNLGFALALQWHRSVFTLAIQLELELIQTQMAQKPMLRAEVGMRVRCANKASAE